MDRTASDRRQVRARQHRVPDQETSNLKNCPTRFAVETPGSLFSNVFWAFTGQVIFAFCQWAMIVALAKMGTPELLGRYSLALAVSAPIIMLSMLNLRVIQSSDTVDAYDFGHYLALRLTTSALGMIAILTLVLISRYTTSTKLLILTVGLFKTVESISDTYHGRLQQRERMDLIARTLLVKGPMFLFFFTLSLYLTKSLVWAVASTLSISLVFLLYHESKRARRNLIFPGGSSTAPNWQWERLRNLAWLALPLGVGTMLVSLNTNLPRYVIASHLGDRGLGYFSALAYPQMMLVLLGTALGQASTPRLARYYSNGQHQEFRRTVSLLLIILCLLGSFTIVFLRYFGPSLLATVYRPDYAQHAAVLLWLMAAVTISSMTAVLNSALHAAHLYRASLAPSMLMVVTTLLTALVLVPSFQLIGAAQATLLGALARFACVICLVLVMFHRMTAVPQYEGKKCCESLST